MEPFTEDWWIGVLCCKDRISAVKQWCLTRAWSSHHKVTFWRHCLIPVHLDLNLGCMLYVFIFRFNIYLMGICQFFFDKSLSFNLNGCCVIHDVLMGSTYKVSGNWWQTPSFLKSHGLFCRFLILFYLKQTCAYRFLLQYFGYLFTTVKQISKTLV